MHNNNKVSVQYLFTVGEVHIRGYWCAQWMRCQLWQMTSHVSLGRFHGSSSDIAMSHRFRVSIDKKLKKLCNEFGKA